MVGGLIYIFFRTDKLLMFSWFKRLGLSSLISYIRLFSDEFILPEWVIYSLPNALWTYSFMFSFVLLWKNSINLYSHIWFALVFFISVGSEIGQLLKIVPGTFDFIDLFLCLIAIMIPRLVQLEEEKKLNV